MKQKLPIVFLVCLIFYFTSCKKETTITVKVFNPALNEYVANATVVLLEMTSSNCTELATATTDNSGTAMFSKEKLHTSSSYHYQFGIKESWGIAHANACGTQAQNYLEVGKTQEVQISDYLEIEYRVRCNNTFNPGISGDSLRCDVAPMVYYDPMLGHTQGGGGGATVIFAYDVSYPMTAVYTSSSTKIFANRLVVTTRKRKLGILTTTVDTVRAYPSNGVTIVDINW
jgi:5-hydroxyisourate hydrolase-like protein (transthyretin family)